MSHRRLRLSNALDSYLGSTWDFGTSKAVRAGNFVFLEGQTGIRLDDRTFVGEGDPAAQAEQAMQNVRVLLEGTGAEMQDICKITTMVTDSAYRPLVYPVITRHLAGVNPVSTGIVVKGLARPELDFEIDVFAVIPDQRA